VGPLAGSSVPSHGAEQTVTVSVADAIDPSTRPDLLVVTVRRQHADAILSEVAASGALRVMFMFNIADDLSRFRDAVGRERFSWGFPAAVARLDGDVLRFSVVPSVLRSLQITTLGGLKDHTPLDLELLLRLFRDAGIPSVPCADMESWLKTHAAFMAPLMSAGALAARPEGLNWASARLVANAMRSGFLAVSKSGARIVPSNMALLHHVPTAVKTFALWGLFRFRRVRESLAGDHARGEAEAMLHDLETLSETDAPSLERLLEAIRRAV
jgi:2-dehydropantoate 2-reductase